MMGEDQAEADGSGGGGRADGRQTGKKVNENFASQLAMFEKLGSMQNRRIFLRDMNDDDDDGGGGGDVEEPSFRNRHSSSENETKERRSVRESSSGAEPTNTASTHDSTSSSDSDSQKRRPPTGIAREETTTKEEKQTLYEISLLKEERESENDDEEESLHSAIFPQATLQSAIPVSTSGHRADELTRRRSSGFLLRSRRVDVSDDDYEKSDRLPERRQEPESSQTIERSSPPAEIDGRTAVTDGQSQVQMLEKIAVVSKTASTSSSSGGSERMKETAEKSGNQKKKAQHDSGEWVTDNEDVSYVLDDEEEEETDIFFVDEDDKDAVSSPTPPPGPIPPKERLQIVFEASADSSDVDEGAIAAPVASSESLEIAHHDAAQLSALLGGSRKKKKTDGSLKGRPSPSVPPPPPPPVTVTEASPQPQQRRQPALPSSTELQVSGRIAANRPG